MIHHPVLAPEGATAAAPAAPVSTPSTPTPTPTPAPSPSPTPSSPDAGGSGKPASTPSSSGAEKVLSPYDELDQMAAATEKEISSRRTRSTPKPPEDDGVQPPADPNAAPATPKPADSTPKPGDAAPADKEPGTPRELRAAYARTKQEISRLTGELEKLRSSKPAEAVPETKQLLATLEETRQAKAQLEEELKVLAWERSDEFKSQYEQPYIDAFQAGRQRATRLRVTEDGQTRQGTAADFDRVMQTSDDVQATMLAEELFGAQSQIVIAHREAVISAQLRLQNAAQKAKESALEWDKRQNTSRAEQSAQQAKHMEEAGKAFATEIKAVTEKYPQYFAPIDGDTKGNELLEHGFKLADLAFSGANIPEADRIRLHAAIRNKAGAFDRMAYLFKTKTAALEKQVADLEAELADYKESDPKGGLGGVGENGKRQLTIEEEIDQIAAQARRR